jgi:glucose-1-phosphate cytidylyltransferase
MDRGLPTIILCGGRGTRISDANPLLPKPMLTIGDRPILWHIMKLFSAYGHRDFVLALGWLGEEIRKFFLNYEALTSDFSIELGAPATIKYHGRHGEDGWRVTCVDTGRDTLTGLRVLRAAARVEGDGPILVTYGDGVGNIDLDALVRVHREHGRLATITAVRPPGRFGELVVEGNEVKAFIEKPQTSTGSISGGFLVLERDAIERYLSPDVDVMLEREPLSSLAADGELTAYQHHGFWQPMDTTRERELLEALWSSGRAPWKVWD